MKPRVLAMCSSWGRPNSLLRMLESFQESEADQTTMCVYISDNDPKIEECRELYDTKIKAMEKVKTVFGPHRYMVEVLNFFSATMFPDFEFYQEINDDHVYRTKHWDARFIEALGGTRNTGLVCGNDLFGGPDSGHWESWEHPSAAMISGNIVRTFRYFNPPGLQQFGGDIYFKSLFKSADLLFHLPDVIIEHMSVCAGKEAEDDRQAQVYAQAQREIARQILGKWISGQALVDVNICRNMAGLPKTSKVVDLDYM
jgi:hypothetical protein